MAIGPNAQPLRVLNGLPDAAIAYLEYTVSSGTVTAVSVPAGWALGNFSTGVAALTFPKYYSAVFPFEGQENTDNASATSRHQLETKTINLTAGTASVRCFDQNDGTTENPVDGTFRLAYLVVG